MLLFSYSVVSDSLQPYGLQHTRPPYPSPTPRVYSNSCPLSQWCHPTISSSVILFSSCLQSFPAPGSFLMSQHFSPGGQSMGASALASVLSMKSGLIFFRNDWFDLLAVQGTLKSLIQHRSSKALFFDTQPSSWSNSCIYTWVLENTTALTVWTYVGKIMTLNFNMLSRLVIAFFPRSKHLLISWLQSPSAVILEPKKIKSHCFHCFPIYLSWSDGTGPMILVFWMLSVKPAFPFSSFTVIKRFFSSYSLSTIRVVSSAYVRFLIFL